MDVVEKMKMCIKEIVIEKKGGLTKIYRFNDTVTAIPYDLEVYNIIKLVLGIYCTSVWKDEDINFLVIVEIDGVYKFYGMKKIGEPLCTTVRKENERFGFIEEYNDLVKQNPESDSIVLFDSFKRQDYPHKLFKYKDLLKYYPNGDFAKLTNGYGTTRSFRGFVTDYIKNFKPIRLRENKDLYLKLSKDGEFKVGYLDSEEDIILSESENMLYHYLSFISIADFWERAERVRNLNFVIKPLLVLNFSKFLDESIVIDDIIRISHKLERQVILFVDR